jgi:hypothetical protein
MTTETQAPGDWVLLEAAKQSELPNWGMPYLRELYHAGGSFRALCDMIAKHEQPPVDRKVLCAREAAAWAVEWHYADRYRKGEFDKFRMIENYLRAIELYEEGFGK